MMTWKEELRLMKLNSIKDSTPNAFEASGGYDMKIKPYIDTTTNGLTRCIMDFLTFKGHYANRINTQGQVHVNDIPRWDPFNNRFISIGKNVTRTKSHTKLGTPDLNCVIFSRSVQIELKLGRDRMSPEQKKQKVAIEKAGGLYFLAKDMQSFYEWYYKTFTSS